MVQASKGPREHTRQKFRKKPRERGLSAITKAFQVFQEGEKAAIVVDPGIHKGQPNKRFHGYTGTVVARQGRSYIVAVRQGGLYKKIIAAPEHLKKVA